MEAYERVGLQRLRVRTAYTCQRFAVHAPHWQFVIWVRQFGMTVVTLIPGILASRGSVDEMEYIRGHADALMVVQVTFSLAILVMSTVWHWSVKPFAFAFQNWLEMWLLLASIIIIVLAGIFSATGGPQAGFLIEIILTSVLVGSVGLAGAYLVIHYRAYLREQAAVAVRRITHMPAAAARRMSSIIELNVTEASSVHSSPQRPPPPPPLPPLPPELVLGRSQKV